MGKYIFTELDLGDLFSPLIVIPAKTGIQYILNNWIPDHPTCARL